MSDKSIGFIGGGRITRIFLEGFNRAGIMPSRIVVSDVNLETLNRLQARFPGIESSPNDNLKPAWGDVVFLAVHPPVIGDILPQIAPVLRCESLLVSLAPKFTIGQLSSGLGGFDRIARVMPNAPSIVNAGYNPVAFSPTLPEEDKLSLLEALACLGQCPVVPEEQLEAYAILAAMGPTCFWFQWRKLAELGMSFGLSESKAKGAIASMLIGAVKTMFESGLPEEEVMELVPVRPLGEDEAMICEAYEARLGALFQKLKA